MCKLVLDRGSVAEFTSVSNIFMDEYMPRANGEFIKIYLHLLRLVNSNNDIADELTTERIADKFNMLESDVIRALNYWAEQNLITLSYNSQNEISGITLESILRNRYIVKGITSTETNLLASASGQSESIPVPESTGHIIPAKRKYTPREILDFADNDTFNDIQLLAQTYLGRPLSSNDINSILYMIDGLCFDADFIEYIMDACIKDGFNSLSSIEKRAVEYAKKDINSIEEAKADILVVGVDGIGEAYDSIRAGKLDATVDSFGYYMSQVATEVTLRVLAGQDIPRVTHTPQALIDKTNVDKDAKDIIGWTDPKYVTE